MSTEFESISFDMPKAQSNTIKVIGVGGGGGNAVNYMFQQDIKGVDFVICNTDAQALDNSSVPNKIQLGASLTSGLGAGANPEIGAAAAKESLSSIEQMLYPHTKMVFITAGMGGGTGTGAAPVIAKMAKEMGLLTVGIITIPFSFEGRMRLKQAQQGVNKLRANVDSLIVINNNKLREVYGDLGFKAGFSKADEVLSTAAKGIAEVITHHYKQNIDLRDAKTVLSNSGTAIMGAAKESGENRARNAIVKALDSPLLNDNKITGAKNVLLLIVSGTQEVTIDEIGEINDYIQTEAGHNTNIIMGIGEDEALEDSVAVTIVATGFALDQQGSITNTEVKKIVHTLEDEQQATYDFSEETIDEMPPLTEDFPKEDTKVIHTLNEVTFNDDVATENNSADEIIITDDKISLEESTEECHKSIQKNLFDNPVNKESHATEIPLKPAHTTEKMTPKDAVKTTDEPVVKHILNDFPKEDATENIVSNDTSKMETADETLQFEVKTTTNSTSENNEQEPSPMSLTISELKKRTKKRREKMKAFNYKFASSATKNIIEIEQQPAYKRKGIALDSTQTNTEISPSRTSVEKDANNEAQLRSNNSFLHDNVD